MYKIIFPTHFSFVEIRFYFRFEKQTEKKQLKPTKINLRPCFAAKPLEAYNIDIIRTSKNYNLKISEKKYKESICNYIFKITHSNYVQTKQKQQICMPIY